MRLSTTLDEKEIRLVYGALQELMWRESEQDEPGLSEDEEALRQRLEEIVSRPRCPSCGSDDPEYCGYPWKHRHGTYDMHAGAIIPCCDNPFHQEDL